MRKTSIQSKRPSASVSPLAYDVAGIAIAALGVVGLVSLASPTDSGEIGRDIEQLLRLLSGSGAFIIPGLAFVVSALLLFGKLRMQLTSRAVAAVGLWLVMISWLHVLRAPQPLSPDKFFAPEVMRLGGGYIGAGLSYFLMVALGRTSTLVILGALGLAALIITADLPLFTRLASLLCTPRPPIPTAKPKLAAPKTKPEEPATDPHIDRESIIANAIHNRRKAMENQVREQIAADAKEVLARPVQSNDLPVTGKDDQLEASGDFVLPSVTLLDEPPPMPERSADELGQNVEIIERTLQEFKIAANVVEIAHGPTVTRYEIQLAPGIRVNKIVNLADNIAMSLAAINVRVEAPIPGKSAIGVEVPNRLRGLVGLKDILQYPELLSHPSKLAFPLGLDVAGSPVVADLASMPHLLVAGATNMGKSVMLNALISSLTFRARPEELRFILIDPKRVELSMFDGMPHLISPVIRDTRAAAGIFRTAVKEMERRYDVLANAGTRNIQGFNQQVEPNERMPYIVIVVDELADLMMQAAAEVEGSICRIAQLARAVGIHLVIATQRPSVDVVTGTIKANIASRISFAVSSQVDSRTVLDQNGAERLIGRGDMLFRPMDAPKPVRIQGAFVSEQEVKKLVAFLREQRSPNYSLMPLEGAAIGGGGGDEDVASTDEYYEPAVRLIVQTGRASTSMIQRRFRIGYTRAARLVDAMEQQGLVGPPDGANPREVLISADQVDELFGLPVGSSAADRESDEEDF